MPDESANACAAMVPSRTTTSMARVPLEMQLSTPGLTLVAWDVQCEMARQSDSSHNLFIDQYFHVSTNMRMKEQFQHWIPSVVLVQPIRRSIRDIHNHPRPSAEKKGENEGSTYASTEPNTQQNRAARTRRDTGMHRETMQKTLHQLLDGTRRQACASFSCCATHANFRPCYHKHRAG